MNDNVKITKAKIKDGLFLEASYQEVLPGNAPKKFNIEWQVPVHADLIAAFANLDKHLGIICDEIQCPKNKADLTKLAGLAYKAKGWTIGGEEDTEGVTISGIKDGRYGQVVLNSPFQRFGTSEYKYRDVLKEDIGTCIKEVYEYIFSNKRAPEAQQSLDFPPDTGHD